MYYATYSKVLFVLTTVLIVVATFLTLFKAMPTNEQTLEASYE